MSFAGMTDAELAALSQPEKKKLLGQLAQKKKQEIRELDREAQILRSKLYPGSHVGAIATDQELEDALRLGLEILATGDMPSTRGIFRRIGDQTGRVPKWAKVCAAANVPGQLTALLPKLADTTILQELMTGNKMTLLHKGRMCQSSPAGFLAEVSRNLADLRRDKALVRVVLAQGGEIKDLQEKQHASEMEILKLKAKGLATALWVEQAVELRQAGRSWVDTARIVGKRRVDVIEAVEAEMALAAEAEVMALAAEAEL